MKKFFCNGASTDAPDLRAAAIEFAKLAAFDAYGEEGMATERYLRQRRGRFHVLIGMVEPSGLIRGRVVVLYVTEGV